MQQDENRALIFNIQRFSVYDGPGIRTVAFFKGCNLRCQWCHNPESYLASAQIGFDSKKCIGCGKCFAACPNGCHKLDEYGNHVIDTEKCTHCFKCTRTCYAKALYVIGKSYTPAELMADLEDDIPYFKSCKQGGGFTFSGGECMLNPDFMEEMVKLCAEKKVSVAIDTAGNVPYTSFERINPYVDYYLYDIKAYHEDVHKMATGVSNRLILENLVRLLEEHKKVIVRIPVIPELNEKELPFIRDFLREHRVEKVELLAYHNMGLAKQELLFEGEKQTEFTAPGKAHMKELEEMFAEFGGAKS